MTKYREDFWTDCPSGLNRRLRMREIIKEAGQAYHRIRHEEQSKYKNRLVFFISGHEVCERAYLTLLNLLENDGRKLQMWNEEVDKYLRGDTSDSNKRKQKKTLCRAKNSGAVLFNALAYIESVVESPVMDRSAFQSQENSIYLPYREVRFFFGEYKYYCKENGKEPGSESTFRRAWAILVAKKKKIGVAVKLSTGKGSHAKCEICHNAETLLGSKQSETRPWTKEEVEVIETYRRRHIDQQYEERLTMQKSIMYTYAEDINGQPLTAFLLPDGMSTFRGNTPKIGARQSKKFAGKQITSRVIGVEVHCGPVHGTFLYYTDNFVRGGANIMIEVLRQSILDLQILLQSYKDNLNNPLDLPSHLILQFDNCKENKNKSVFTYISLLVQLGHFRKVEVFFLIVGHTHCSIDQYFSSCATEIWNALFIGSPLALEALLARYENERNFSGKAWKRKGDSEKERAKPLIVRKISVVYDMVSAFKRLTNKKIKYFIIPHCFVFELFCGVCCMQYKMFSTHTTLLPPRPDRNIDISRTASLDIVLEKFAFVGGEESFMNDCGASKIMDLTKNNDKIVAAHGLFKKLRECFEKLEADIISATCLQFEDEILEETRSSIDQLSAIGSNVYNHLSHELSKVSSPTSGLIMWLTPGVALDIVPEPIHLSEIISFLENNYEYVSTGYDIYDLYQLPPDFQYPRAAAFLLKENKMIVNVQSKSIKDDLEPKINEILHFYGKSLSPVTSTTVASLESTMKEIKDVAVPMGDEIHIKKVHMALSDGILSNCFILFFSFNFYFIFTD